MAEPNQEEIAERIRSLTGAWAAALAQILESMTEHRPRVDAKPLENPPPQDGADVEQMLWWEQSFQILEAPAVWVGAPQRTWEDLGGRTLRSAGLENSETADVRNTYLEILSQSLAVLARGIGGLLQTEVLCGKGAERSTAPAAPHWYSIEVHYGEDAPVPLLFAFSAEMVALLENPAAFVQQRAAALPEEGAGDRSDAGEESQTDSKANPKTMALLYDVELPVSISFGRTQLLLKDVLKLTTGSIVELNRGLGEPVEVQVNNHVIARGEVVVIDGNYGVRIQQILSRHERLKSLR